MSIGQYLHDLLGRLGGGVGVAHCASHHSRLFIIIRKFLAVFGSGSGLAHNFTPQTVQQPWDHALVAAMALFVMRGTCWLAR